MQFHVDGFRAGDPRVRPADPTAVARPAALPDEVDVLIVGCGPRKGRYGLVDYEKAFTPDSRGDDIFDLRRIARDQGALVVVRPDQYVSHVLPLDAYAELAAFFAPLLIAIRRRAAEPEPAR